MNAALYAVCLTTAHSILPTFPQTKVLSCNRGFLAKRGRDERFGESQCAQYGGKPGRGSVHVRQCEVLLFPDQMSRESEYRAQIIVLQMWIVFENPGFRPSRRLQPKQELDCQPRPLHARASAADFGIGFNALFPVHGDNPERSYPHNPAQSAQAQQAAGSFANQSR